jgi:hypothetical protein
MKFRNLVVAMSIIALAFGGSAQAKPPPPFSLYGERGPDGMKLVWHVYPWPADAVGVKVGRREVGLGPAATASKADWNWLTKEPLQPQVLPERDWSQVEPDAARHGLLRQEAARFFKEGKLPKTLTPAEFVAEAKNTKKSFMLNVINHLNYMEPSACFVTGFGLMDRSLKAEKNYQYGLFLVHANGTVDAEPVATLVSRGSADLAGTPTPAKSLKVKIRGDQDGGLWLDWSMRPEVASELGITGFWLVRHTPGKPPVALMKYNASCWHELRNGKLRGGTVDKVGDEGVYEYEFIPETYWRKKLGPFKAVPYKYAKADWARAKRFPFLQEPQFSAAGKSVKMAWEYPEEDNDELAGFIVMRQPDSKSATKEEEISKLLPPETRSFVDESLPPEKAIRYRVVAVDKDGERQNSGVQRLRIVDLDGGMAKIPAPSGFKVACKVQEMGALLTFTWDKPAKVDPRVTGYEVRTAFGTTKAKPDATSCEQMVPVGHGGEESICILEPVVSEGFIEKSTTHVYVPLSAYMIPKPELRRYAANADGTKITWMWKYPDNVKDLKGFRIYRDGVMVASEEVLGGAVREWTAGDFTPGKTYKFQIQAVTSFGVETKRSQEKSYTLPATAP